MIWIALCETVISLFEISVIEDESLSRNSSFLQRRKKRSIQETAAEQKPDREGAQYINFPTTVAGIVLSLK